MSEQSSQLKRSVDKSVKICYRPDLEVWLAVGTEGVVTEVSSGFQWQRPDEGLRAMGQVPQARYADIICS